ncbi:MAG TPA: hypothetical protein VET84_05240 [Stellaceae bacterium]|nr:hypothetical protein [Stellaceae bacterium]
MKPERPLITRDEVIHLVGDLDDSVIVAILRTGASYVEVENAVRWATDDTADIGKQKHESNPRTEAVYDLLMGDPNFLGIERER